MTPIVRLQRLKGILDVWMIMEAKPGINGAQADIKETRARP